jgi:hypothetical protein
MLSASEMCCYIEPVNSMSNINILSIHGISIRSDWSFCAQPFWKSKLQNPNKKIANLELTTDLKKTPKTLSFLPLELSFLFICPFL